MKEYASEYIFHKLPNKRYKIYQLGNTDDLVQINLIIAKLSVLPSGLILHLHIQDFMHNIFLISEAQTFALLRA